MNNSDGDCLEGGSGRLTTQRSLWEVYRSFIRRNRVSIDLVDDLLSNFLLFTPQSVNGYNNDDDDHDHDDCDYSDGFDGNGNENGSSYSTQGGVDDPFGNVRSGVPTISPQRTLTNVRSNTNRWREVLYGLLSLHRLGVDMALQERGITESFGTTVALSDPQFPATTLRIVLTVTHSLLPTFLQLCSNSRSARIVRAWLERIKFVARLSLLVTYWSRLRSGNQLGKVGLMQDGGLYHPHEGSAPTVEQEHSMQRRHRYVGRRTGRRVTDGGAVGPSSASPSTNAVVAGELLYILRPLYWAEIERIQPKNMKHHLFASFVMDAMSFLLLRRQHQNGNAYTKQEIQRRKLKLFLYLLRTPVWDHLTKPSTDRVSRTLSRVPLLGGLIDVYLRDWLYYLKHPYVTEEG